MANSQLTEPNPWNPFLPTRRDIQRTKELSPKNPVIAGILSFLFPPIGMLYLNRGVNSLKIIGYVFIIAFITVLGSDTEEEASELAERVGLIGNIAIVVEQINTVNKARQRKRKYLNNTQN